MKTLPSMARLNDTISRPRANRNETNDDGTNRDEANNNTDQENRRSSVFIDGDENEERHLVTLNKFLQYAAEKPEWLYEKLRSICQCFEDVLMNAKLSSPKKSPMAKSRIERLHCCTVRWSK